MKILLFDTETSGFKPGQICQLSYIIIDTIKKGLIGRNYFFEVDFVDKGAYDTHGLSVEKLKELSGGKTFYNHHEQIRKDFEAADIVVAHNIDFDKKFINAEFENCCLNALNKKTFCTMAHYTPICKIPGRYGKDKWPKLEETIKFLNIKDEEAKNLAVKLFGEVSGYHDSRFDIAGTYLILIEGLKRGLIPKNYFSKMMN